MCRSRLTWTGLFLLACLGPASCGGGLREVPVSGEVTLDAAPLKEGVIRFTPLDGGTPTQAAQIENGKFKALLCCTSYRVEISATRPVGSPRKPRQEGPGDDPLLEELIPPRYNARSELRLDVKEARKDVRYDLKSK
jgi:hypothetical protein